MSPKQINNQPNVPPSIGSLLPVSFLPGPVSFEPKKINLNQKQKMFAPPKKGAEMGPANKLIDSENRPLNQTFTIAKSKPSPIPLRRNRANSFDSDFADFGPDVIFGFISRKCNVKNGGSMKIKEEKACFALGWSSSGEKGKKNSFSASTGQSGGTKLPSLEGFIPGRNCCQLQFSRSNFELIKYKRNLKKN